MEYGGILLYKYVMSFESLNKEKVKKGLHRIDLISFIVSVVLFFIFNIAFWIIQ